MQAILTWIRGLDIRKVAVAIIMIGALEHGIIVGEVPLDGAVPASWIPHIVAWCKIFVYVNPFLVGAQSFTALKWPTGVQAGMSAGAKQAVALIFAIGFTAALAFPARAQTVPLPTPNPLQTVITNVQNALNNLIGVASGIASADLNLALADAKAQGNTGAAACWTSLLALNLQPVPTGAGLAYLKQRLLDAEAQYVSVNQNCNGPAPLIVKAYDAFVAEAQNLQI